MPFMDNPELHLWPDLSCAKLLTILPLLLLLLTVLFSGAGDHSRLGQFAQRSPKSQRTFGANILHAVCRTYHQANNAKSYRDSVTGYS